MDKKQLKTPKFVIAMNEMVKDSGQYIIHMRNPLFFAEIFEHENKNEQSDFHNQLIQFQKENNVSIAVGRDKNFYQPFTLVAINPPATTQEEADNIAKIMRRMADWYQKYCKWEDENYELG